MLLLLSHIFIISHLSCGIPYFYASAQPTQGTKRFDARFLILHNDIMIPGTVLINDMYCLRDSKTREAGRGRGKGMRTGIERR
jgi:hypothetical protein